jgi:hypothetical protein
VFCTVTFILYKVLLVHVSTNYSIKVQKSTLWNLYKSSICWGGGGGGGGELKVKSSLKLLLIEPVWNVCVYVCVKLMPVFLLFIKRYIGFSFEGHV